MLLHQPLSLYPAGRLTRDTTIHSTALMIEALELLNKGCYLLQLLYKRLCYSFPTPRAECCSAFNFPTMNELESRLQTKSLLWKTGAVMRKSEACHLSSPLSSREATWEYRLHYQLIRCLLNERGWIESIYVSKNDCEFNQSPVWISYWREATNIDRIKK